MIDLAENQLHIVLVNAVIEKSGKFLIAQRSWEESHMPGWWSLPGGKVDRTEGIEDILVKTLRREVKEEVGLEIEENPVLIYNGSFIRATGHHVIDFTFLCQWKSGEAKALEDSLAVAWVSPAELGNYQIHDSMKDRIFRAVRYLKSLKE